MSHFALVINDIVQQVIVAEQDFIDSGVVGDPKNWIQTSYNSRIRNKYAAIGDLYLKDLDIFVHPKPYPSWKLKKDSITGLDENYNISVVKEFYIWESPVPGPSEPPLEGYQWIWDENTLKWRQISVPSYFDPPVIETVANTSSSISALSAL